MSCTTLETLMTHCFPEPLASMPIFGAPAGAEPEGVIGVPVVPVVYLCADPAQHCDPAADLWVSSERLYTETIDRTR